MDLLTDPKAWFWVGLFSILGVAGNLALYRLGKQGLDTVKARLPRIKEQQWTRAQELFEERGSWTLILSAIPVAGMALTTAAGAFGVPLLAFVFWVFLGKLLRNWILVLVAFGAFKVFTR